MKDQEKEKPKLVPMLLNLEVTFSKTLVIKEGILFYFLFFKPSSIIQLLHLQNKPTILLASRRPQMTRGRPMICSPREADVPKGGEKGV